MLPKKRGDNKGGARQRTNDSETAIVTERVTSSLGHVTRVRRVGRSQRSCLLLELHTLSELSVDLGQFVGVHAEHAAVFVLNVFTQRRPCEDELKTLQQVQLLLHGGELQHARVERIEKRGHEESKNKNFLFDQGTE